MYYEGDLSYFESINKETIKNALSRLLDVGIILLHKGQTPPLLLKPTQVDPTKIITWIAIHPDWLPKNPLPMLTREDIQLQKVAPGLENEKVDNLSVWYHHRPAGKLWDFCEKIGKFRREGKNRRDSQTVASRVLRLARLSRVWVFDLKGRRVFNKL